ncbi:putative bifunctional diguanylate cyclase/phosphodiesterase [Oceanirhabdus seepicola]|uniref:EAL domain-containing protein n=1 Tax=Oceanirhabdus seepicola TaxID=2828781 RepID=A0A9J6P869_9CLOT|nr:GGDEF domain-containing phosphodiesterase [Oceanirhabdus seepicola]MCM1991640.1 EAL domain-containing protein [Oceanirhabdus seepicola]
MNIKEYYMNEQMIGLIFLEISSLLLAVLFFYLYKKNKMKSFFYFSMACFVYTLDFLLEMQDEFTGGNIIGNILLLLGKLLLVYGLYVFLKNKILKYSKYIIGITIPFICILSFDIFLLDSDGGFSSIVFAFFMIAISFIVFIFFKNAQIGKYISGVSSFFLGAIYIIDLFTNMFLNSVLIWYLIHCILFLLIGIGMVICYYETTQIELAEADERYRLAIDGANDGLWEYDLKKDRIFISARSMSFLGIYNVDEYKQSEVWTSHIHVEDFKNLKNKMSEHLTGETEQYICEYRIKNNSGEYVWIYDRGKALFDEKGVPYKITGFHTNITERKKNEERINYVAYYDEVTGVHNKAYISKKVDELENEGFEKGEKHAVLVIDIDDFKYVNDLIGHVQGDFFLKVISERIKSCLPTNSIFSRYSGDEFIVLLYDIENINDVKSLANKILQVLSKKIKVMNHEFFISASSGITVFPDHGKSFEEIFMFAEIAMNKAKELGKNRCIVFNKSMNEEIIQRVLLEKSMYEAIKNKEFIIAYQLQKDLKSDSFTGAEALVRWRHPEKGLIPPNEFIPLAEETGLIIPIGELILREACKKIKNIQVKGIKDFSISVNVSSVQLKSPNFIGSVKNILNEIDLDPKLLTLEITESILMESLAPNIKKIEELRALGIKIALDDFGTGYSSFNYIIKLPIDILKIDKSFIDEIHTNQKEKLIVGGIISVAKKLNFNVVAEGVENIEQLEILKEQNCDKIQGYIFSKPVFENELDKLLLK